MILIGPQHHSPPWRIATSGFSGVPSGWKHHPGGHSYERSQTRWRSLNFARRVRASFQLPKVMCDAKKMEKAQLALPFPHCIERDMFLPFNTVKFGSQDYHMKQPLKTLAYAKALQYWVEKANQCQVSHTSLWSMYRTSGTLTMFTDDYVLGNVVPSSWVRITLPEHPCQWNLTTPGSTAAAGTKEAYARSSFAVAHGIKWLKPSTVIPVASSLTIPANSEDTNREPHWLTVLPSFVIVLKLVQSLFSQITE